MADWALTEHAFEACKNRRISASQLLAMLRFPGKTFIPPGEQHKNRLYCANDEIWAVVNDINKAVVTVGLEGEDVLTWKEAARRRRPLTLDEQNELAALVRGVQPAAFTPAQPVKRKVRRRQVHPAVAALGNALDGVHEGTRRTIEEAIAARGYGRVQVLGPTNVLIVD